MGSGWLMVLVANSRSDPLRIAAHPLTLVLSCLFFLFSGFYKEIIPSPIDLTVVAAALLCFAIVPRIGKLLPLFRSPAIAALAVLAFYLAIRLVPHWSPWGVRKLAEYVLFGFPALLAGYLIVRDQTALEFLLRFLSYAAIPASIFLAIQAALTNPYATQGIGSGGYQLTGTAFAIAALAALVSKRQVCLGFAILGLSVIGHLSGALFSSVAMFWIWLLQRERRILPGLSVAAMLILVNTMLVAPPLVLMRVLFKGGGVIMMLNDQYQIKSLAGLKLENISSQINRLREAMPVESQIYEPEARQADRIPIMASAITRFLSRPVFGWGYGAVSYAGSRSAHNIFLELLAEGGIVAGALLAIAFIFAIRSAWRYRRDDPAGLFVGGIAVFIFLMELVSGHWGERLDLFSIGMLLAFQGSWPTLGQDEKWEASPTAKLPKESRAALSISVP